MLSLIKEVGTFPGGGEDRLGEWLRTLNVGFYLPSPTAKI
jgi:hypothetical protein